MKVLNPILNIPKDVLDVPHLALQSICNLVQDMGHIGHLLVPWRICSSVPVG